MSQNKQLVDVIMTAIGAALADLHTATIAKITKVGTNTISCRPVINRVVNGESITLPEFVDVPPIVMQGGGSYTAYPLAVGDYCFLLFSERCFDRWWNGQDYQPPLELRMHDYSDGVALVGLNPLASLIAIPSTIKQVGDTEQLGDYTHTGNRTQTGDFDQTGGYLHDGDLTRVGDENVTGDRTQVGDVDVTGVVSAVGFSGPAGGPMVSSSQMDAAGFKVSGTAGVSGTFTSNDGKTITVVNGIITGIV